MHKIKILSLLSRLAIWIIVAYFFIYITNNILDKNLELIDSLQFKYIISSILFVIPINLLTIYLLCISWKHCLFCVTKDKIKFKLLCKIYIKSNIAKYLPSGVLNFFSRGYLAKDNITAKNIALSSTIEVMLSILSNFSFLIITLTILKLSGFKLLNIIPKTLILDKSYSSFFLITIFLILIFGVFIFNKNKYSINSNVYEKLKLHKKDIFIIILCNLAIFILEGLCFYVLLKINSVSSIHDLLFVFGCFSISSVVGFLMPLVPAGIGIKEGILITLLSGNHAISSILIAALTLRLVTIAVEFSLYYLTDIIFRRS